MALKTFFLNYVFDNDADVCTVCDTLISVKNPVSKDAIDHHRSSLLR